VVLSEALVIGAIAAGIAAAAALAAARTFDVTFPTVAVGRQHFASLSIAPDWWTLTIAVLVTLVTAGGAAAIAALRAVGWGDARGDVRGASSPHDHGQRRLRTVLVSVQVTVALLMLMGTGLLLQNAPESLSRAIHFDAGHLHAAGASLRLYGYDADRAQRFYSRMLDGLRGVAGVQDVAVASAIPGATDRASPETVWLVAGLRNDLVGSTRRITAAAVAISPGFLEVAGIPLEHGRAFTQADGDGAARTAILSRSAADVLFPGRDPIGLPLSYGFEGPSMTIVGVVADPVSGPSHEAPFAQPANMIFVPFAQHPAVDAFVVMRMPAGQAATDAVRAVTRAVDDRVGLDGPWSVQERFLAGLAPMRALRLILLSAAAVAVGIALLGVYGVLACFVEVRIREFGIRLALGAAPAQVVRLVFDHTMHVLLIGLLSGVFAATAAARLLEHTLVALMPNEILTWALAPTALLLAGLVAGCIPAIRAARVDPAVTLRHG
jgi:hypothetical protein